MMQGQDSTSNAFPGNFYLDYGSNGIHLRWNQNNVVPTDASVRDGHTVTGWMGQSSMNSQTPTRFQDLLAEDGLQSNGIDQSISVVNAQTPVRFQDLLAEDGLLSSPFASSGTGQSLEEKHSGPLIAPFQHSINMSLGNGQLTNTSFPLQQASSSVFPLNIDLNATFDSHSIDANLNTVTVEENNGGEGHSTEGRRLPCKRRAPEDAFGRLSMGESSKSTQLAISQENTSRRLNLPTPMNNQPNGKHSEQLGAGLMVALGAAPIMSNPSSVGGNGRGAGAGESSNIHQAIRVAGEADHSQRNIRLRRTVNHQDSVPTNLATLTTRNSHPQLPAQPAVLFSFDGVPNTSSVTGIVQPTPPMRQPVRVPYSSENMQPFQLDAVTGSRIGLPLTSNYTVNGGDVSFLGDNSRNNQGNRALPEFQRGSSEDMLRNLNFVPGMNSPGNIAHHSRNSSTLHVRRSSAPIRFGEDNMAQQYAQRISNIFNYNESQGEHSYSAQYAGIPTAARERELSVRGGNSRLSQIPLRSGWTMRTERLSGARPEVAMHNLTAAQRRSRLLSEDVMVIDRAVFYGIPEEPDLHEDMRLDVDNMSYEELLALGERIGNVSTGLSEDVFQAHIKRKMYEAAVVESPLEEEPCCICQEDYVHGEDLGKLDCDHEFHFNCIKQWLVQKNNCPICKKTGLEV
ncbi:hypothetical protein MANES_13G122800v8 [Manihot esculenta]|uniref:Uncharacterized protein n=1 Tax=Manihot esculenta TaxID=3983 RepID=A0ACB7GLH5_MANES|nr:hypothetical protein MANES_13G122800v8 [Manihot esculenta]